MMTSVRKLPSKTSLQALSAIARYRHQRRSGRVWLIGDRRVSSATVASLERAAFLKEIAVNGNPVLVITDQGKQVIADGGKAV
jgi:hypothetical protein